MTIHQKLPQRPPLRPRLLLVEDDLGRVEYFQRWLEGSEFVLIHAQSGGKALGVLSKSCETIAGVLLDHDLSDSPLTSSDSSLSTSNVMPLLMRNLPKTAPVLIHSHNASKPPQMQRALESAGLSVTHIRFANLAMDDALFQRWLEEVRDNWDPELV